MKILIYEDTRQQGLIWQRFLLRLGYEVHLATSVEDAAEYLSKGNISTFIVDDRDDMVGITTLTDLASYANPDISIIAVTSGRFFTDGTIFKLIPNIRSCISHQIELDDLGAMVDHYSEESRPSPAHAGHANR